MSILVDTVRVSGFRGLQNVEITLPRVTILIGSNNSGKTSLLKALGLVLGDYQRNLSDEDFHIGSDGKQVKEITVDVRIVPTDQNIRQPKFTEQWAAEFGDNIKSEPNGNQYLSLRARTVENLTKGGFDTQKYFLEKWPEFMIWKDEKMSKKSARLENILYISIDAQRDIHIELRNKASYIGKVLADVHYDGEVVKNLEAQIAEVNIEAVEKSQTLKSLKGHLENLNNSFEGSGKAEITPFPKKIRDLSKNFSVHIGDTNSGTFPMEYHGMGTRSWASMLTVKAFSDMISEKHAADVKPFFSILAAEEPEAHLHPNAQKTLYRQLAQSNGQVIVSTHSPYLASLSKSLNLRYIRRDKGEMRISALNIATGTEDERKIEREILNTRGEILFSKALILCEGETEEQALSRMFVRVFGSESFEFGVSVVGVGGSGARYKPFLQLSRDFDIPCFIFSDGENETVAGLRKTYEEVYKPHLFADSKAVVILDGCGFEKYLIEAGYITQIETAISVLDGKDALNKYKSLMHGQIKSRNKIVGDKCVTCGLSSISDEHWDLSGSDGHKLAVLKYAEKSKTKLAPVIADELAKLENSKLPPKIMEFFEKVKVVVK